MHHCMMTGPKGVPQTGGERPEPGLGLMGTPGRRAGRRGQPGMPGVPPLPRCLRFKADNYLQLAAEPMPGTAARSVPNSPRWAGCEMGLFLPFASRGMDMEGIAEVMKDYGSMSPSFHLAWHFEEVDFETVRPFYMQASLTADWNKGGWSAAWEATGGPQQLTGQKAPFVPEVRDKTPGFTVDEGIMRQLMLHLDRRRATAASASGRGACAHVGWEGGEYGLVDRNYRPTDRAVIAGKIGQACRRLRDELWTGRKEPLVGVFQDFDMEAIWAATAAARARLLEEPARQRAHRRVSSPDQRQRAVGVRDGQQTPQGTAPPATSAIMLPAASPSTRNCSPLLTDYVTAGGRVVLDAPGGWFDYYGRVLRTDDGTAFERLSDAAWPTSSTRGKATAHGASRPAGRGLHDRHPAHDRECLQEFDHSRPDRLRPAVTEHRLGKARPLSWIRSLADVHCARE